MKYDFVYNYTDNILVDTFIYTNNAVHGLLIYSIILAFMIILSWVFIKHTDDVPLSLVRSLFATVMISTIIYYMGRKYAVSLFDGSLLITLILVLVASIGIMYYQRHQVT